MQSPTSGHPHWLLWDGACGFCRECVRWLNKRDRQALFHTIPYQEAPSPPMNDELRDKCRAAVQVISNDETVYSAGRACAFVLERIGYRRLGRLMQWRAVRPLVEWGYRRVANNRNLIGRLVFGKNCAQ